MNEKLKFIFKFRWIIIGIIVKITNIFVKVIGVRLVFSDFYFVKIILEVR